MTNRVLFALALAALAVATSTNARTGLNRGENLLQPVPPPGEAWRVRGGANDSGGAIMAWLSPDDSEYLRTEVFRDMGGYPSARFREISDAKGREACGTLESNLVTDEPTNGFERVLWQVNCVNVDGAVSTTLHLFISGEDSSYYLFYRWKGTPDASDAVDVQRYFRSVSVCDTRKRRDAPCN